MLVVSCPCALSLATPAALAAAAGALGRRRILCVRQDALETLSRVSHVVLDKTGTLTTGDVRLAGVDILSNVGEPRCLALAAALERGSSHPIASALSGHASSSVVAQDVVAVPGCGMEGTIGGVRHRFGRRDWAGALGPTPSAGPATGETTEAWLATSDGFLARIVLGDEVRPSASPLVAALRRMQLRVSILSGDADAAVGQVAESVGITDWRSGAKPDDKRAAIAELQQRGAIVAMVGDGINDAPGLARADVSIALGNAATLTRWTADVVVLGDDLEGVAFALNAGAPHPARHRTEPRLGAVLQQRRGAARGHGSPFAAGGRARHVGVFAARRRQRVAPDPFRMSSPRREWRGGHRRGDRAGVIRPAFAPSR